MDRYRRRRSGHPGCEGHREAGAQDPDPYLGRGLGGLERGQVAAARCVYGQFSDPIDGTAEFVQEGRVEFCSVVCLLEDWLPVSAFVLAPELGAGRTPLVVTADARERRLTLNGEVVTPPARPGRERWISATRSAGAPPRGFDPAAEKAGFLLKTRTTSQTLDMIRTAVDLSLHTDSPLPPFELFWRRKQKVWDGIAGLCLGTAAGLRHCDENGQPLPAAPAFFSQAEPVFASTVMGKPEIVSWFLDAPH